MSARWTSSGHTPTRVPRAGLQALRGPLQVLFAGEVLTSPSCHTPAVPLASKTHDCLGREDGRGGERGVLGSPGAPSPSLRALSRENADSAGFVVGAGNLASQHHLPECWPPASLQQGPRLGQAPPLGIIRCSAGIDRGTLLGTRWG